MARCTPRDFVWKKKFDTLKIHSAVLDPFKAVGRQPIQKKCEESGFSQQLNLSIDWCHGPMVNATKSSEHFNSDISKVMQSLLKCKIYLSLSLLPGPCFHSVHISMILRKTIQFRKVKKEKKTRSETFFISLKASISLKHTTDWLESNRISVNFS